MAVKLYKSGAIIKVEESGKDDQMFNTATAKYRRINARFILKDEIYPVERDLGLYTNIIDENDTPYVSEQAVEDFLDSAFSSSFVLSANGSDVSDQNPLPISDNNELSEADIDWDASDFTGWTGEPRELFRNVNDGLGIYNDSIDNPKSFTLRLKRTKKMRDFGIGTDLNTFSNLKATLLGSGDSERGVLDLSPDPADEKSFAYSQEEFIFNGVKVEFFTADRIDVTNLFFKYTQSNRKQDFVHKFGFNSDVDSGNIDTVWSLGGEYIFTTTAQAYYISSSDAADTQEIEGELILINAEGRYQRYIYTINLQGQTKVQITTPNNWDVIASNRAYNNNANALAGTVYVYEDSALTGGVPDDLSKVRSVIEQSRGQTEQAVYTVPEYLEDGRKVAFAEVYNWQASAIRNNNVTVGAFDLKVAEKNKVPLVKSSKGLSNRYVSGQDFGENTPLVVEPGSDIFVNASDLDANNVEVQANFTVKLVIL